MSWLTEAVAAAKAKLNHPGAPTEGQLTELAHMLEALGITAEGKVKGAIADVKTAADAPIAAVEHMIADAKTELAGEIAKGKLEVSSALAAVFKEFEAKQVAAVAAVQSEVDQVKAAISPASAVPASPAAPAPSPAAAPAAPAPAPDLAPAAAPQPAPAA